MGSAGKILYDLESSYLSGDVIKRIFDICSRRNFLFRDLPLSHLREFVKLYRDEQQDTSE
jgi:hypothetical protein